MNKKNIRINFKNKYNSSKVNFKISHNVLQKLIDEYKITNNVIRKNIDFFYKITKIYVDLFIKTKKNFIKNNDDVIFTILKFHEGNIKSEEEFSKEKLDNIFVKELLFELEYL